MSTEDLELTTGLDGVHDQLDELLVFRCEIHEATTHTKSLRIEPSAFAEAREGAGARNAQWYQGNMQPVSLARYRKGLACELKFESTGTNVEDHGTITEKRQPFKLPKFNKGMGQKAFCSVLLYVVVRCFVCVSHT